MRVTCQLVEDGSVWRCESCGWSIHRSAFRFPPQRTCRKERFLNKSTATIPRESVNPNRQSIEQHGPERNDAEVLYIIANFCMWCPAWSTNPNAKKKCKHFGCGSTETVENLHRRRIRNCPKRGNHPAKWTETTIQQNLHPKPQKPT